MGQFLAALTLSSHVRATRVRHVHLKGDGLAESPGTLSVSLEIPILLKTQTREVSGYTSQCSHDKLQVLTSSPLRLGTPLSLQFTFGGKVCYLTLAGRVAECRHIASESRGNYSIVIQFAGVREFEQTILRSALEELARDPGIHQGSLVTIVVRNDAIAEEAIQLSDSPQDVEGQPDLHDKAPRKRRKFTSDPEWVSHLKHHIAPYWEAVLQCPLVQEASAGTLPLPRMRAWMTQLYPFIQSFPKWLALSLTKAEDAQSRSYLIENIRVEKKHAEQWLHMAQGFGIPPASLEGLRPLAEVDAITHWLWSINTQGSLAEGVGATSYAIEGVTHDIAVMVVKGFPNYEGRDGVHLDKRTYWWMEAHAKYDDLHPVQALEIMKLYTHTTEMERRVTFAAQRSLEYLRMAFDACYAYFPSDSREQAWHEPGAALHPLHK